MKQTQTQTQNSTDTGNLRERDNELNRQMKKHPAEESIEILVKDAQRRKRQLQILTATVALTLIAVIGLVIVSYKLVQVSRLTQSNKAAVIANCEVANDSRRNQLELWNYVLSISPEEPRSEAQRRQTEDFRTFVNKTFAQRNCQQEIDKQ